MRMRVGQFDTHGRRCSTTWRTRSVPTASLRRVRDVDFAHSLEPAKAHFDMHGGGEDGPYADVHGWVFTPSSFALAMLELSALDAIDFTVVRSSRAKDVSSTSRFDEDESTTATRTSCKRAPQTAATHAGGAARAGGDAG